METPQPLLTIQKLAPPRTFRLIGEVDLSNACWVRASLDADAKAGGDLTLDLTALRFMDCSGRHALAQLARKLDSRGRLILRNSTGSVERLLNLTDFGSLPNLVFERQPAAPEIPPTAELRQEPGVKAELWGLLGLAQSMILRADDASFTLKDGSTLKTPVSTSGDATDCDKAQYRINDGPCVQAAQKGRTVNYTLDDGDDSLRPFVETARSRGFRAVSSIPILGRLDEPLGGMNFYSRNPAGLPAVEQSRARVLAIRSARVLEARSGT
ncbi:MAG TPA: STAS domain-containing protein [Actinomycetota bacterium]|nr:STAS domain-containing protein [Actinomycetota bacterium]